MIIKFEFSKTIVDCEIGILCIIGIICGSLIDGSGILFYLIIENLPLIDGHCFSIIFSHVWFPEYEEKEKLLLHKDM